MLGQTNYKEGAIVLLVIVILAGIAFFVLSVNAEESRTWKNFDDGVEYFYFEYNADWTIKRGIGVIHNGETINCYEPVAHGGTITLECFEIILRHELDRRGLQ